MIRALSNEPLNGRWLLTGLVGRGGAATVYRGFDLVAERLVAIKTFGGRRGAPGRLRAEAGARSADGVLRLAQREFLDQARVGHPNLVKIFELGEVECGPLAAGTPFFTMELLDAAPIPARDGPRPDPERLFGLAQDLLAALGCLHAHGLVHNDVKPSNILFDHRAGQRAAAKLCDFGLVSRGPRPRSGSRALSGTLHYLAPEAISGARRDARSDLYSLGVLLYEAATGSLPFNEADPAAALAWHMSGPRPDACSAPALPPALARVIARLLQARPEERPASARDAWEELAGAASPARSRTCPGAAMPGGPLIGRREELGRLATWLAGAARDGGRLRIVGEAGSGLSRFAREAAVLGRAEGWLVHEWACSDGDAPFSALRRPLRELILRGRAAPPRGRRPSDGELLALLGGPALWAAPGGLGGDARRALAAAIASFFTTRVQDRPLLVVLDDFERADEGSRRVIETLARHHGAERAGILVVTGEHEEAAPPGAELRLGPLGLVQARRLLASLPCMDRPPGARETEALIRASGRLPGRLARLGCLSGGPQRLLFPPLAEPRASA